MRIPFRRRRPRLEELNEEISQVRGRIALLEESVGRPQTTVEPGDTYEHVGRLRASLAGEELEGKRAELDALLAEAARMEAGASKQQPRAPRPAPRPQGGPARTWRRRFLLGGAGASVVVAGAGAIILVMLQPGGGASVTLELAPSIPTQPAAQQGQTFFTRDLELTYASGPVIVSGPPPPQGPFFVDDAMSITVTRPDGTTAAWNRTFNVDCEENAPLDPQDVTDLFRQGVNKVSVVLRDVCGSTIGAQGPIFLFYLEG